ncbi:hypothetical protein ASF08_22885 [Methylobacterium sp. Leaf85]|nr:hypothetical protein ASF08_22885 [Methylobacterium sp. Leaf85]
MEGLLRRDPTLAREAVRQGEVLQPEASANADRLRRPGLDDDPGRGRGRRGELNGLPTDSDDVRLRLWRRDRRGRDRDSRGLGRPGRGWP